MDILKRIFGKRNSRSISMSNNKWHAYTQNGKVTLNPELGKDADSTNPLLVDSLRFCLLYMQGLKRSEIMRDSEQYFRSHPSDLAMLLALYGKGGLMSGVSNRGPVRGDDSSTAAPYLVCDGGKIQIEEDYEDVLRKIYKKLCNEGML